MSAEVFIECPFCREQRANYLVRSLRVIKEDNHGRIHPEAKISGHGDCYICKNHALLHFSADDTGQKGQTNPLTSVASTLQHATRKENGMLINDWFLKCVQTFPEPERLDTPDHLPQAVKEVFTDADNSFHDQRWRSAVTGYGTTIDFACTEVMQTQSAAEEMTLGQKMAKLRDQGNVPASLVDLMEMINIDRRASVHYRKPVEESAARAARGVTIATLEYLFTLPQEIEAARKRLKDAKD